MELLNNGGKQNSPKNHEEATSFRKSLSFIGSEGYFQESCDNDGFKRLKQKHGRQTPKDRCENECRVRQVECQRPDKKVWSGRHCLLDALEVKFQSRLPPYYWLHLL